MKVRGIDEDGDWLFGKAENDYRTKKLSVEQNIKTRLSSFLGDCFFSLDSGIDWFNLLGAKSRLPVQLAASSTILNTTEVISINSIDADVDSARNLKLTYSVNSIYGLITDTFSPVVQPEAFLLVDEDGTQLTDEDGTPLETDQVLTNTILTDENDEVLTDEDDTPLSID